MFMHTRDVDVANAAFNDLGRTDKLRSLDSPYFDDEGFFVEETGTNTGGRYSVHFIAMVSSALVHQQLFVAVL